MDDKTPASAATQKKRPLFSVIRRLLAYFLDGIFLVLIAFLFFPFSGYVNRLGLWGIVPLWLLFYTYGTLLDGRIGRGQTFGKEIARLKVRGENGAVLSWSQASIRGVYLVIFGGAWHNTNVLADDSFFVQTLDFLFWAFFLFDILFVLKHPQNRSLLDIISNSLVHDVDYPTPEFVGLSAASNFKGWIALVGLLVLGFWGVGNYFNNSGPINLQGQFYRADIEASTRLKYKSIGTFSKYSNGQLDEFGTVHDFWLSPEYAGDKNMVREESKKAREIILSKQPPTAENGSLKIVIEGHVFIGLVPVRYSYKNFDL